MTSSDRHEYVFGLRPRHVYQEHPVRRFMGATGRILGIAAVLAGVLIVLGYFVVPVLAVYVLLAGIWALYF